MDFVTRNSNSVSIDIRTGLRPRGNSCREKVCRGQRPGWNFWRYPPIPGARDRAIPCLLVAKPRKAKGYSHPRQENGIAQDCVVGLVELKPATIRLWIMGLKGSYEGRDCDPIDVAPSAPGTGLGYRPASAKSPFRFIRRPKGRPFEDGISPAFEAPKIAAPATRKSIARSAAHRSRQDTSDGIQGTAGRVAENDSYWPLSWIGLRRCRGGKRGSLMPFVMAQVRWR